MQVYTCYLQVLADFFLAISVKILKELKSTAWLLHLVDIMQYIVIKKKNYKLLLFYKKKCLFYFRTMLTNSSFLRNDCFSYADV